MGMMIGVETSNQWSINGADAWCICIYTSGLFYIIIDIRALISSL